MTLKQEKMNSLQQEERNLKFIRREELWREVHHLNEEMISNGMKFTSEDWKEKRNEYNKKISEIEEITNFFGGGSDTDWDKLKY